MARYAKYTDVAVARIDDVKGGKFGPVFVLKCQPPKEGKKVPSEATFNLQMDRAASTLLARQIREEHGARSPKGLKIRVDGFRVTGQGYRNATVDDGIRFSKGDAFPEGETFKIETVNGREVKRVYYANTHYAKGRGAIIVPDQEQEGIFAGDGTAPNVKPDAIPQDRSVNVLNALLGDAADEEQKNEAPATSAPAAGYAAMVAKLVAAGVDEATAKLTAANKLADTL